MVESRLVASVDGLRTYLHCPRRYQFAHVYGLDGDVDDDPHRARFELLRRALCDALRTGETRPDELEATALNRLSSLWADHGERFHSLAQRRHERRVLEATVRAYVESVGTAHAEGVARLESTSDTDDLVGPELPLSSTYSLPERERGQGAPEPESDRPDERSESESPREVRVDATVDYVYADGSSLVGVSFVPTHAPLGLLRYRSAWDGDVETLFSEHFDDEEERFEPDAVGALFETAVVLEGLRNLRDRLGFEGVRTCRHVTISLADSSNVRVNWVRETVETSLEPVDLTDVFLDHHTFGMTHEHRNESVETRLAAVLESLATASFDPDDRWDEIAEHACPECAYAICCEEAIASEVRFDG